MPKTASPFNLKTIIAAAVASVVMVMMEQYSINVVLGSYLAIDHMPAGGIFLFFLVVLFLNPILRALTRERFSFSPAELLVIYSSILVSASIASMGLGAQLLPILVAPVYYATSGNRWAELILPHIKPWLAPTDPAVITPFFEGLPPGGSIPWGAWLVPVLAWGVFLMALFYATICAISILRREWVDKERLAFPLVQLPLAMVTPGRGRVPALFRSKLFWLGFAVPFALSSVIALVKYFPSMGTAPLLARSVSLFRGTTPIYFRLSFPILGFSYLINTDIAFSVWFFNLMFLLLRGWLNVAGISSPENVGIYGSMGNPILAALGTGAFIVFFIFNLYLAREHLKDVFLKATGRGAHIDDSGEVMSYRHAFWGFAGGLVFLLLWLTVAGMGFWTALLFLCLAFVFWLVLTRIIAESGLATLISPSIASAQVVSTVGSQAVGEMGLVNLGLTYTYAADIRTFPASATMQSEKLAESFGRTSLRPLAWVMLGALLIGFVVSTVMVLHLAYRHGGINLSGFFTSAPQVPYVYVADHLRNLSGPNLLSWVNRFLGGGLMFLLLFMRNRFLWWPLHPLGFAVGMVYWVDHLWLSIFIAWLVKSFLLRYGGPRVYESGKPLFFGFVLGQYSAAGAWFLVDMLTGMTENKIFWI